MDNIDNMPDNIMVVSLPKYNWAEIANKKIEEENIMPIVDIPYTHTTETGEVLNVFNVSGYARNTPVFIGGRTKYDAAGRWNNRGICKIKLMELDQIFIDDNGLYTIGKYIKHWTFNGYIPKPDIYEPHK